MGGKRTFDRYIPPVKHTGASEAIDALLAQQGFNRRANTWVRGRSSFSDVIDIQRGNSVEGVTVNVALQHAPTYELAWSKSPNYPLIEPDCVVRTRLGFLVDGRDRWWRPDDQSAVDDIIEALTSAALPFLANFKDLADVEQWLDASQNRYPPEALYRAAVQHQRGYNAQARDIVEQLLQRTTSAPWRERICSMAASLA